VSGSVNKHSEAAAKIHDKAQRNINNNNNNNNNNNGPPY
jgi:hypothetical protein